MSDQYIIKPDIGNTPATANFNLPGDYNTLIAHANNINNCNVTNILISGQSNEKSAVSSGELNKGFYSLFVYGCEKLAPFSVGHILLTKDRALTESTEDYIKEMFWEMNPEQIAILKTLPSIFASENLIYGKSNDEQQACFGIVTGINVQSKEVRIDYQTLNPLSQKRLNCMLPDLDIYGNNRFNEFDRSHWAIKHVSLIRVLREAGFVIYAQ